LPKKDQREPRDTNEPMEEAKDQLKGRGVEFTENKSLASVTDAKEKSKAVRA
jgi:hypothetical protein